MSITITRNTGIRGMFSAFDILVDGEKVKQIKHNESVEVDIPGDNATLQLVQQGVKSNELTVSPGEEIKLQSTFLGSYGMLLMLTLIPFIVIFGSSSIGSLVLSGLGMVFIFYLVISHFRKGKIFEIEKTSAVNTVDA